MWYMSYKNINISDIHNTIIILCVLQDENELNKSEFKLGRLQLMIHQMVHMEKYIVILLYIIQKLLYNC